MSTLKTILNCTTVESVTRLLETLINKHQVAWKPVGGRDNNLATINMGSDPAAGLTERITNALDAVLERAWMEQGQPSTIRSPRDAVEDWFGIAGGRLDTANARDPSIARIADNVVVTLQDSSRVDHPTVDIRDYGIGLRSEDFGSTILGLNEGVKLDKFFLAGAFGQGGSTAFSYSQYGLILSRRLSAENAAPYPVAFTIVRFYEGDLATDKHGRYEYLVSARTGLPFHLNAPIDEFPVGTLVRHVHMDIGKYYRVLTAPTNSLWYLTHHYLFDPVLPFRIEESRDNASSGQRRFVGGNRRRLIQGESEGDNARIVEYQRAAEITFRTGRIVINWWVLSADGDITQARQRITNYVLPSRPFVLTYNGQKQGELPNTIIRNDLKLPYLDRYLIVQVDCDDLDAASRRQLFATTRETLRESKLLDDLRTSVTETLDGDDELRRLDLHRKQRYLQRPDSASTESLRKRLANRIRTHIQGGGGEARIGTPPTNESGTENPRPPIPVLEPPTLLEIYSPSPKEVYPGRQFRILFRTDANPDYFKSPDAFIPVISPPTFGQYSGSTDIRDGYGIAYFRTSDQAQIDDVAEIRLELRPNGSPPLTAFISAIVISPPEGTGTGPGRGQVPNIRIVPVGAEDAFFIDNGWTEYSVASVQQSEDETAIFVSIANRHLNTLLSRAQRRGTEAVESIKDYYIEHICFHAFMVSVGTQFPPQENGEARETGGDTALIEAQQDKELLRASETITGMINQLFDYLVQGASSGDL